jgi:hypothetical protein
MEDLNLAGFPVTTRPRKQTLMKRELQWLTTSNGRRNEFGCTRGAERSLMISGGQNWCEVRVYRAGASNVCNHHALLHRPPVFAIDETLDSAFAVVLRDRMRNVHRLALSEQSVLRGSHA